VWTPQHVNADEKSMLEKMSHSANFKPQPEKDSRSFFDKIRDIFS
jgi:molecular chaperone DnaJ